ncbi:MAG: hypothetical protein J1F71_04620 [Clostridiales bacterium]|nr:hypothetical protein [Clostridiales bacterium]
MIVVQKSKFHIAHLLVAALVIVAAALLFGCAQSIDVSLSRDRITLFVGERRDILPYVVCLPAADKGDIVLHTDSDCVAVDGTALVGVKAGTAQVDVTSHGKKMTMTVDIDYGKVTGFVITAKNDVQTAVDAPSPVIFTAEFGKNNAQGDVRWESSDGVTHEGSRFEYTPSGFGEFTVTAALGGIVRRSEVKVYRRTQVTVLHTYTDSASAYMPITFTATERINSLNPKSVYLWQLNGKDAGKNAEFTFTPGMGRYTVALFVNGEKKQISGSNEFTVNITKDTHADCEVAFDDMGGVYIRYAKERKPLYISLTAPGGKRSTFDATDAQYSHLFGDGLFRATEYIDVCDTDPQSYTIVIGTDGDRHEFVFSQLGMEVKPYLDDIVLLNNSFISSVDDARRYVGELYAVCAFSAECYAAGNARAIEQAMIEQAEMLGLSPVTTTDGNVIRLTFSPFSNAPTDEVGSPAANNTYVVLPHIEYEELKRRASDYIFSSDRAERSVKVVGGAQLLYALQNGYRPITAGDDVASNIYRAAKSVLYRIIGANYTDRQKVHAVYDWLQFVTVSAKNMGVDSIGRFVEGVFMAERAAGSGYVVDSEGTSKAFGLLCAVEGIECVLLRNTAYGYYNKVKLDGLWYVVDVYGGKLRVDGNTGAAAVEFTSHRGLLISDEDFVRLGCNVDDGYKAFDNSNTEYLVKHGGEKYFDSFIDKSEVEYPAVKDIVYFAMESTVRGNVRIPHVGSEVIIYNNTFGVEIGYNTDLSAEEVNKIVEYIDKALDQYANEVLNAEFASARIIVGYGTICAVAGSPTPLSNS